MLDIAKACPMVKRVCRTLHPCRWGAVSPCQKRTMSDVGSFFKKKKKKKKKGKKKLAFKIKEEEEDKSEHMMDLTLNAADLAKKDK